LFYVNTAENPLERISMRPSGVYIGGLSRNSAATMDFIKLNNALLVEPGERRGIKWRTKKNYFACTGSAEIVFQQAARACRQLGTCGQEDEKL
jgi:hypothetical protein